MERRVGLTGERAAAAKNAPQKELEKTSSGSGGHAQSSDGRHPFSTVLAKPSGEAGISVHRRVIRRGSVVGLALVVLCGVGATREGSERERLREESESSETLEATWLLLDRALRLERMLELLAICGPAVAAATAAAVDQLPCC